MVYQYGRVYRLNRARHHMAFVRRTDFSIKQHAGTFQAYREDRGVMLGSQQGGQAIPMKDSCGSDSEVSDDSNEETSDDLKVPHAGDLKISVQSDSSGHSE